MTVTSVRSTYNRRFSPDSVPGLVIDLDARDLAVGGATSWIDRKNGYIFSGTPVIVENTNNFSSHTMSLGARVVTHDYPWTGNIGKVLLYNRHLTNEEMLYLEMGVAKLGGIVI
jgi:hypothetical protein